MREWEVILRVTLLQNHQFNLQRVLWAQHKGKGSGWQLLLILMQKMLLNFWGASSLLFCQWVAQVNEHNPIYLAIYQPINLNSGFGCRMCMRCGIPKTYSSARGMVCPQCGDRPLADANEETDKKKGSTIKEKEKNKRMKGQSSHASWKSETEMQLRQQYD